MQADQWTNLQFNFRMQRTVYAAGMRGACYRLMSTLSVHVIEQPQAIRMSRFISTNFLRLLPSVSLMDI